MKLYIEIKETPRGDVEIDMKSDGIEHATYKEATYAQCLRGIFKEVLPKLGKQLGARAAIFGNNDPTKS